MVVRCSQSGALKWMEYRDGTFLVYLFVPSLRYEGSLVCHYWRTLALSYEAGDRRTDLVFQSKKIARRRNTNVIAIAKMADGTRGAWKTKASRVNSATPSNEAIT